VLPNSETYIRADWHDTVKEFVKSWATEKKQIESFFDFITNTNIATIYRKTIGVTFDQLLDSFFNNKDLKASLAVLLQGNMGLPPSKVSGFVAVILFKEFLLDPGYYPVGGMQKFADYFSEKFKKLGGELLLSKKATQIIIRNGVAKGVQVGSNSVFNTKFIISGVDATQTFKELISVKCAEKIKVEKLEPANSVFVVYIGIKNDLSRSKEINCNTWYFKSNDIEHYYERLESNYCSDKVDGILLTLPWLKDPSYCTDSKKRTVEIFSTAPYMTESFWDLHRDKISENMLRLAQEVLPELKNQADLTFNATPDTLFKYTLNRNGSAFGWSSTFGQINSSVFPQETSIKNLFLVGHWCTMGTGQGGISTVALSGKKVAELIVNRLFKNN
jgi:phytoene dehydrogenase-like protein